MSQKKFKEIIPSPVCFKVLTNEENKTTYSKKVNLLRLLQTKKWDKTPGHTKTLTTC